jgi:hypothetical protein
MTSTDQLRRPGASPGGTSAPTSSRDVAGAGWTYLPDPRTTPPPKRRRAGPHRGPDGASLHGGYQRLLGDGQVDGVAYWHGHILWRWRGPAMLRFRSLLVSPWNLIRGNGLTWDVDTGLPWSLEDPDRWIPHALLEGLKPYGYCGLSTGRARAWARRAELAGVTAHVAATDQPGMVSVAAGRREPYQTLFDLDALLEDYRAVLPPDLFATQVLAPLEAAAGRAPGEFAGDFAALEAQPLPLLGLTLGYPPSITAGAMLDGRYGPEQGAYPQPPPNPLGDLFPAAVASHLDRPEHATVRPLVDDAFLEAHPGLVHYAFRRCWGAMHEAEMQRRPRHCPFEHGGRHPSEFALVAAWGFLARHGVTPQGVQDPAYPYNGGLRWATDYDDPDPGI